MGHFPSMIDRSIDAIVEHNGQVSGMYLLAISHWDHDFKQGQHGELPQFDSMESNNNAKKERLNERWGLNETWAMHDLSGRTGAYRQKNKEAEYRRRLTKEPQIDEAPLVPPVPLKKRVLGLCHAKYERSKEQVLDLFQRERRGFEDVRANGETKKPKTKKPKTKKTTGMETIFGGALCLSFMRSFMPLR